MAGIEVPNTNEELTWNTDSSPEVPEHPNSSSPDVTTGVRAVATVRPGRRLAGANDNNPSYGHHNTDAVSETQIRPTIPFAPPRDSKQAGIQATGPSASRRPSLRAPITPGQVARSTIKSIVPPPPGGLLPISDATPVQGIHTDHLYMATSPSKRRSLRGSTVKMEPSDELIRQSRPSDRPAADKAVDPDWKDLINDTDPIVSLSETPDALVDIHDLEDHPKPKFETPDHVTEAVFDLVNPTKGSLEITRTQCRTILPPALPIANLNDEIANSHRNTEPGVGPTYRISIEKTNSYLANELRSIVIDDKELAAQAADATARHIPTEHQEKTHWLDSLKNSITTAANKISDVVRSSIASIFSFRKTIRQSFAAILLAAGLNAIASSQGTPIPQAHANEPSPVSIEIAPTINPVVDNDITTTGTEVETPVAQRTFSKTITVANGHSPHVTFVQALTEFLTDNGTRAALPVGYQHKQGDAIRILHQLERSPQHEAASHLRQLTHTGDRFSFSVMSNGSISLDNWQNRHNDSSQLPTPLTFDLPAHL